ncbi:hypothetical protein DPMN_186848 [Dreissena polymorpha]|uniref:Uncharacterized protein n=1 Tax=Dreissena polymorpha TaxID=45954 RepID=A0A9D4DND0_DREPO|nr:hypothetical protein DPMN_186848 [Dreissena polymorpha]
MNIGNGKSLAYSKRNERVTHTFDSREERLLSQEMKLRDMEISLSERMQKLECKLEMRENRITEGFWKNERNETVGNTSVIEKCSKEKIYQLQRKIEAVQKKWGLRLEEMLLQITRKTKIDDEERRSMLKKRFLRGLKSEELRNSTRVHFENNVTYEELRNKVRE